MFCEQLGPTIQNFGVINVYGLPHISIFNSNMHIYIIPSLKNVKCCTKIVNSACAYMVFLSAGNSYCSEYYSL